MSTVITKVEQVTEAIEALVLAQVAALSTPRTHTDTSLKLALNIADARAELSTAFTSLLQPTLRIVASAPPAARETLAERGLHSSLA